MLISCDKCSTLYELDEKLVPAGGAPVQCSKCQFVFRAYPPPPPAPPAPAAASLAPVPEPLPEERRSDGAPAERSDGTPAERSEGAPERRSDGAPGGAEAPAAVGSSTPGAAPSAIANPRPSRAPPAPADPLQSSRSSPALRAPTSGPAPEVKFTPDGRPIRKVPFPEPEATPAAGPAPRAQYAVRVPGAAKRPVSPGRWLVPLALALALAVAAGILAWTLLARKVDPGAGQRRSAGRSLLQGDPAGRGLAWTLAAPPRGTGGPSAEN